MVKSLVILMLFNHILFKLKLELLIKAVQEIKAYIYAYIYPIYLKNIFLYIKRILAFRAKNILFKNATHKEKSRA